MQLSGAVHDPLARILQRNPSPMGLVIKYLHTWRQHAGAQWPPPTAGRRCGRFEDLWCQGTACMWTLFGMVHAPSANISHRLLASQGLRT